MILPLTGILCSFKSQTFSEPGRVKAFVQAARIGLDPEIVLPPYVDDQSSPQFDASLNDDLARKRGWRIYTYNQATVYLDGSSGRIAHYYDSAGPNASRNPDGTLAPRKVSDEAATVLIRRFYKASGWPGEIEPFMFGDGEAGNTGQGLVIHYVPTVGGVRYDEDRWQGMMTVNRETGQLNGFDSPVAVSALGFPSPPASLVPRLSPEAARLAALRFGVELRGESLGESPNNPMRLRVWLPRLPLGASFGERVATVGSRIAPDIAAALAARRGMLVYVGWLLGGSRGSGVRVAIDANTGNVLGTEDPLPEAGGAGGGTLAANLAVPTTPRPWRVATKGGAWGAPVKAVLTLVPAKVFNGKKRITLTDDKLALAAAFDPKSGLLSVKGADGKNQTYRPDPALASLLRRKTKG